MSFFEPLERRLQLNGGTLDTSFGVNGTATVDFSPLLKPGWSVLQRDKTFVQDSGGRLYAMSMTYDGSEGGQKQLIIARLTRDGQLDTSFASGGYRVLDRDPYQGSFSTPGAFVDPNNRMHIIDGDYLWRLTPSGKIDRSFGRRGKIQIPALSGVDKVVGSAFDANGLLYLCGSSQGRSLNFRMTVVRLTESGAVDTTWGYGGAYKSPARGFATAESMRFLPNGDLLVAGSPGNLNGTWTTRLLPDGSVDTSYADKGYFDYQFTPPQGAGFSDYPLSILPDGSVIGYVDTASDDSSQVFSDNFKISADGKQATDVAILPKVGFEDAVSDAVIPLPDGRLLGLGPNANLFRALGDGSGTLDPTWGTGGYSAVAPSTDQIFFVAPDGSVILLAPGPDGAAYYIQRLWRDDAPLGQFNGHFIAKPRTTAIRFSVVWRDDDGVNQSSIDSNDIAVRGPFDGQTRTRSASLELVEDLGGGRYRATYKITSPDGWDARDNGLYTVKLKSKQVSDVQNHFAPADTLGTFRVKIG